MRWWSLLLAATALAGCSQGAMDAPEDETAPVQDPFDSMTMSWDGEFLAGGVDDPVTYEFEVPEGTTEVEGILTWSIPGAVLDFQMYDPTGQENGDGWIESDSHRYVTSTKPVVAGPWTAVVSISQGVDAHYTFAVEARQGVPFGPISRSYEVMPDDFAEVNLNMMPGDFFTFDWNSDGEVYFNVHFHNNGTTDRPIEHTGTGLDGEFTAPANEVYSMLWRNNGVLPVTVTFEMDGEYRLHSMTRDQP